MFQRNRHTDAINYCKQAIAAFEEALRHAPNDAAVHSKKGHVFGLLAISQSKIAQQDEALASTLKAVRSLSKSLEIAPDNKGDLFLRNELLITLRKAGLG